MGHTSCHASDAFSSEVAPDFWNIFAPMNYWALDVFVRSSCLLRKRYFPWDGGQVQTLHFTGGKSKSTCWQCAAFVC